MKLKQKTIPGYRVKPKALRQKRDGACPISWDPNTQPDVLVAG